MGKENIRDILSKTQAGVSRIEENARKRVGALMEQYEKDKKRRMKVGNQALQSAVITDLAPKHEQFEFAVKR